MERTNPTGELVGGFKRGAAQFLCSKWRIGGEKAVKVTLKPQIRQFNAENVTFLPVFPQFLERANFILTFLELPVPPADTVVPVTVLLGPGWAALVSERHRL